MNENNQPPISSSKKREGARKLSASARKRKAWRVSEFTQMINDGQDNKNRTVGATKLKQSRSDARGDVLAFFGGDEILTQDFCAAIPHVDAIIESYNSAKESLCSGRSDGLSQDTNESMTEGVTGAQLTRATSIESAATTTAKSPALTTELKEKIEANRLRAKERRQMKEKNLQSPGNFQVAPEPSASLSALQQSPALTTELKEKIEANRLRAKERRQMKERNLQSPSNFQVAPEPSASLSAPQQRETMEQISEESVTLDGETNLCIPQLNESTSDQLTLTQLWCGNVHESMREKSESPPTDLYFARGFHGGKFNVSFKRGDVWYSSRYDDCVFLIEQKPVLVDGSVKAKVRTFLPLEKTFIGQKEAAKIGIDWVLVKKHETLPSDGYISTKDLSTRMTTEEIPFPMRLNQLHLALRYEDYGDIVSFYYKNGTRISFNNQCQPRCFEGFAGGGGFSLAARNVGFLGKYKLDLAPSAIETLRHNFPDSTVFHMDIRDFNEQQRRGMMNLSSSHVDFLPLSPPCNAFSAVNTSGGCRDIQNSNCTLESIETIRLLQPSHVTMENVSGILHENRKQVSVAERTNRSYLQEFMCGLLAQEFQIRLCKRLNAKHYGDPQDRERVVVFATKRGYALPQAPLPTHGNEPNLKKIVTTRDVLQDLENIEPTDSGIVILNDGSEAHGHFIQGTNRIHNHEPDEELHPDLPSRTVRKKNRLVHYNRKRNATVLERARLMSFPDNHVFKGTQAQQADQIGNAIPLKLGTAIANAVMESFRLGLHEPPLEPTYFY